MLFSGSQTAPSSAPRRYEPQIFKGVRALVAERLITLRRNTTSDLAAKAHAFARLRPSTRSTRCGLLCLLLAVGGCPWALAQSSYTITDLGVGNQWYSEAHGLNNGGWAVGEYEPAGAL